METLNYSSLYEIIKYQYDKIKTERDGGMTEEELARRAMYDRGLDFVNNPSFGGLGELTSNMMMPTPSKREPDDPSKYIYNSREW